jgi:hypothetical protein
MNFDVAKRVAGCAGSFADATGIATEGDEGLASRDALRVPLVEGLGVEDARQRARAAERTGEAHAFFVAKRKHRPVRVALAILHPYQRMTPPRVHAFADALTDGARAYIDTALRDSELP